VGVWRSGVFCAMLKRVSVEVGGRKGAGYGPHRPSRKVPTAAPRRGDVRLSATVKSYAKRAPRFDFAPLKPLRAQMRKGYVQASLSVIDGTVGDSATPKITE
ncbi:MAG: hypothetical protein AAF809_11755, partial [Bacteroidota bacterium]